MAKAGEEAAMGNFKLFGSIIHDLRPSSPEKRSSTVDPGKSREKDIVAVEEGEAATSIGGVFSEYINLPEDVAKVSKEGEEGASAVEAAAVVLATDTEGLVEDEERPFSDKGEAEKNRVKKPDKLVPCPRCKSLNTKFCYFNNCNAKQPRHYCRKCERYWTAGGTLRNVPRGSGRRKSKNSSAHWLHATEGISVRSDIVGSAPQLPHSTSSTVLPKNGIKRPSKEGKEGANECQSLPPTIDELAMASSSSVVTQSLCLSSKEAQATTTGLVGSSPFGFPMGQCPYGYGLFGWNNGAISPMDGGRSTKSSSPQLPQSSTVLPLKRHLEASPEVGNEGANECQPPPNSPLPTIDELAISSSLCLSSEDAQAATAGLVGSSPFGFPMGQWPYGYGLFGSNNVPISPIVVARSKKGFSPQLPESSSTIFPVERHFKEGKESANECQPSPPLSESAMASSSLGTQTLSAPKEAQATTTGLMGSSPFSFPMGQWPYGYGLLGWNNTMIPPIDGGRSFPTLSDPSSLWGPWMGVGFPWPLMPTPPYSPWNIPPPLFFPPWAGSTATGIASIMASGNNYGPPSSSPTLGKHSREVLQADSAKEGRLFTPKTLRIHDPKEAAQSSIWSALGLDNRPDFPISSGTIFRGFPPKADESVQTEERDGQAFHVNPAAMTRSMAFHENS